jgi:hypothetical protein
MAVLRRALLITCLVSPLAAAAGAPNASPAADAPGGPKAPESRVSRRLLIDAEFVARDASLVVEAKAGKQAERSSRVEFEITTVIKGTTTAFPLVVDLAKAPFGRWPREGQVAILCLVEGPGGTYVLQSNYASIIPSVGDVRNTVVGWFNEPDDGGGKQPGTSTEVKTAPPGKKPEPVAAAEGRHAELARTCDAVLIGSVSKVQRATDKRFGASASFGVAEALYGFAGYPGPITIMLPPAEKGATPQGEGWHVGFFKEIDTGEGLLAVALVRLVGGVEDEKLKAKIKEAVADRKGELTTLGATLRLWERGWNRRELDTVIRCYATSSVLRRRYNAGGRKRERLAEQVERFTATVSVTVHKIERTGPDEADVSVTIDFVLRGRTSRKEPVMKLVREEGDWRILLEDVKKK